MSIAQEYLAEFEMQSPITRRYLERVPADKLTWKPHDKSLTVGQLAFHIAYVPGAIAEFVAANPVQARESFVFPQPATHAEILKAHDDSIATVRRVLPGYDDASMRETWRLVAGESELLAVPRAGFLRDIMLSHLYQHRGQLSVYLRMLNVAVPASWGPSADEAPLFLQQKSKVA